MCGGDGENALHPIILRASVENARAGGNLMPLVRVQKQVFCNSCAYILAVRQPWARILELRTIFSNFARSFASSMVSYIPTPTFPYPAKGAHFARVATCESYASDFYRTKTLVSS